MKTHKTVTITEQWLRDYGRFCWSGIERMSRHLPATISTDPNKNLDLACDIASRLIDVAETGQGTPCDVYYMVLVIVDDVEMLSDSDAFRPCEQDPGVIAQQLAAIADKLLTEQGR